jgi:hypothetical protein
LTAWLTDEIWHGGMPGDGCAERTHVLGLELFNRGFSPRKAWAIPVGKKTFDSYLADHRKSRWNYHVAIVLPVRKASGQVEGMVFDPGLFDGPAALQEWGKAIRAKSCELSIRGFSQLPPGHKGNFDLIYSITKDSGKDAEDYLRDIASAQKPLRVVFASASRLETMTPDISDSFWHGKTWITKPYKIRHPSFPV